ncbi:MAG: RnfABCDGE type electron transport complex subunit D [bacterium]|jgi:electron transport complex protein RnfD|nr:RnfABCDGE type electron transport complex subunit D [bacterium]
MPKAEGKEKGAAKKQDQAPIIVGPAPHFFSPVSVPRMMWDVVLALIPAFVAAIYFFGIQAFLHILSAVLAAVVTESVCLRVSRRPGSVRDGSAVVTGMLIALCLPSQVPYWMSALGAVVAIVVGKHVFGGLGQNIFNPALVGRAFLLASWPQLMTTWKKPVAVFGSERWWRPIDSITTATPLAIIKKAGGFAEGALSKHGEGLWDLFLGHVGGSLGETSVLALLIGALYLFYRGHITWHIPIAYIGTVGAFAFLFMGDSYFSLYAMMFHLFAGGLVLGAFFMATDLVTTPISPLGRVLFGVGAGCLTCLIRAFGGYPEGVCYSILLMNTAGPLIDRLTVPRRFGEVPDKK